VVEHWMGSEDPTKLRMQKIEFYQTESGCKGPYSKGEESYSSAKGRNNTEVQEKS